MDKEFLIDSIKSVLEKDTDILFAYLFGSLIYFDTSIAGDIDIAIYLKPMELLDYLKKEEKLTSELITILKYDKIDLRILNILPFILQYNVIKEGILIFVRDELERIDFEVKVMNKYFNIKPLIEESQRMVYLRIKSGL